jgi:hypothetical protein
VAFLCQENKTGVKSRGRPSSSPLETEIELKKMRPNSTSLPVQDVRRDEIMGTDPDTMATDHLQCHWVRHLHTMAKGELQWRGARC